MPSRVKLLNGVAGGTTGTPFKIGMGQPPYTIRVWGGFTNGGGTAGTNGVNIQTSPNLSPAGPFPTAAEIAAAQWDITIAEIGGENETETQTGELKDLHDKANCMIKYYCKWIRAVAGANLVGTAFVTFENGR